MGSNPGWSRDDDKRFEKALNVYRDESSPTFFEDIALFVKKPINEVYYYYKALVDDVELIQSDNFDLPRYQEDDYKSLKEVTQSNNKVKEKAKGNPWTAEEQRLFLEGLEKFGKGDWKNISRECVKSKNPMQVASHAQKYYIRQNSDRKKGKRSSIHDMTLGDVRPPHVTVPGSNLKPMGGQPEFGGQIPPCQNYYPQNNVGPL
ncbi:PREDICTED: transcription factor DIVARICATA-like [Camelina sativa]|uniref:Transcription factor DIVARICATA-like n=1 Tax=Camelina sativa TaxID=90675 RepID=A0ABM0WAI9_CAMSA|nr:PREDICTED: transcription factor DIVARICATA-like [Camelina sativa]